MSYPVCPEPRKGYRRVYRGRLKWGDLVFVSSSRDEWGRVERSEVGLNIEPGWVVCRRDRRLK